MKRKFQLLFVLTTSIMVISSLSAQTLMRVHLNDGSIMSALVSNIDSVTWIATDTVENNEEATSVTGNSINITTNSATITAYANGILNNLATDIRVGIVYTSNGLPTRSNGTIVDINKSTIETNGYYSITLTGLTPETKYSYRSFVYQSGIWFYGDIRSFTTSGLEDVFTTGFASSVTCFSAIVAASANLASSSQNATMTFGICYGTSIDPTIDNQCTIGTNRNPSTGEYTAILRGLYGGTTYYYRPYAIVDDVAYYGKSSQFRTLDDNVVETLGFNKEESIATAHLILSGGAYSTIQLGFCYGRNDVPSILDYTITTDEVDDDNHFSVILPLLQGLFNLRPYVLIDGISHYGSVISTSLSGMPDNEAIDLGLSVLWAPMNVGAVNPEDYGFYYAWGETEQKTIYDWNTYKYCNGTSTTLKKYCLDSTYGTVDQKTVLESIDDAATVNWGENWRMPTYDEFEELNTQCTWTLTTLNGVNGYKVTGPNGNSIFLPAAGCYYDDHLSYVGEKGYYLSSTLNSDSYRCRRFSFDGNGHQWLRSPRYYGPSVRPVLSKKHVDNNLTFTITGNGKTETFKMILVEPGTFQMGRAGSIDVATPVHNVTLTKSYYIAETEVTQALWYAVMGEMPTLDGEQWNETFGLGDNHPAYAISYDDCTKFITRLNQMTGQQFRMPTEAEWEYAAKGGVFSSGFAYAGGNTLDDVGWYNSNHHKQTCEVKLLLPNELGLYDMSGNVWEWCADWRADYSSGNTIDPKGPNTGEERIRRGGCAWSPENNCNVALRASYTPDTRYSFCGLRIAM